MGRSGGAGVGVGGVGGGVGSLPDGAAVGVAVGAVVGLSVGTLRDVSVVLRWLRMLASVVMAADLLSVRGARGDCAVGCCSAWMMSLAAALIVSTEDAVGMVAFVGNQLSVSQMRVLQVFHIQMTQHQ